MTLQPTVSRKRSTQMVKKNTANRALSATHIPEQFDLPGATSNGGAGPFIDYTLGVRRLGGAASVLFDPLKASNAKYTGGFSIAIMVLLRPLGYLRPLDFSGACHDPYLAEKIGADRLPDASTVSRDLHRLEGEEERRKLRELHGQMLKPALLADGYPPYVILDGDSSVEVVYGDYMEGAAKGYNPRARGRKSYHPLIFSDGVRDLPLNAWLRPGNCGDGSDFIKYYRETRDYLSTIGRPIIAVRLDRGFRGEVVYVELENDEIDYAIKAAETKRITEAK
ncbi:MAG: transposase, partial [Pseudomonadota bacterium]